MIDCDAPSAVPSTFMPTFGVPKYVYVLPFPMLWFTLIEWSSAPYGRGSKNEHVNVCGETPPCAGSALMPFGHDDRQPVGEIVTVRSWAVPNMGQAKTSARSAARTGKWMQRKSILQSDRAERRTMPLTCNSRLPPERLGGITHVWCQRTSKRGGIVRTRVSRICGEVRNRRRQARWH